MLNPNGLRLQWFHDCNYLQENLRQYTVYCLNTTTLVLRWMLMLREGAGRRPRIRPPISSTSWERGAGGNPQAVMLISK